MGNIYFIANDKSTHFIIEKMMQHSNLQGVGFQNGTDLLEKYHQEKPDMILLNTKLPGMSGLEILKEIRKLNQSIPIIMISALQSDMDKVVALDMGADDYIVKPFGVLELSSRIQAKLRRNSDANLYEAGNIIVDDKQHTCLISDHEVYLTNKEFSILKLLLKNKSSVVSKEVIFKDVWETDFIGETRTLDMHIKSLRQKLNAHEANVEIKTIRGVGYIIG